MSTNDTCFTLPSLLATAAELSRRGGQTDKLRPPTFPLQGFAVKQAWPAALALLDGVRKKIIAVCNTSPVWCRFAGIERYVLRERCCLPPARCSEPPLRCAGVWLVGIHACTLAYPIFTLHDLLNVKSPLGRWYPIIPSFAFPPSPYEVQRITLESPFLRFQSQHCSLGLLR